MRCSHPVLQVVRRLVDFLQGRRSHLAFQVVHHFHRVLQVAVPLERFLQGRHYHPKLRFRPELHYRNRFRSLPDLVPCLPRGYCCITLYQPGS